MDFILKLTAICIVSAVFSLLIKKINPEFSLVLGISVSLLCMLCAVSIYQEILLELKRWQDLLIIQREYFIPLLKCLGISAVSRFGVNVCKDAGQLAVSSVLDFASNLTSLLCLIPLINHVFDLLKNIL